MEKNCLGEDLWRNITHPIDMVCKFRLNYPPASNISFTNKVTNILLKAVFGRGYYISYEAPAPPCLPQASDQSQN